MKRSDSSENGGGRHDARTPDAKTAFDWPRDAGLAEFVVQEMNREVGRRRRTRRHAFVAVAAVALLIAWMWPSRKISVADPAAAVVAAAPVVPQRQVLPDGSVVFLRDNAEIAVDFTPAVRRVSLLRGEASFKVAKNAARPFVVHAGVVSVQAVGTEFFVKRDQVNVDVLVTEGCVAVAPSGQGELPASEAGEGGATVSRPTPPTLVNAGRCVSVSLPIAADWKVLPVSPVEVDQRSAWRAPKLTFTRTPLHEVVDTMNRYGATRLILEDGGLENVQLSGAIRGDNIDALLELLEADYGIRAERRGEFEIVLGAAGAKPRDQAASVGK